MDEQPTRNLYGRSFEEQVMAQFGAMNSRFDSIDVRLQKLEARNYDTKPIWERALAEITKLHTQIAELSTKVSAIESKLNAVENKVEAVENRLTLLETKVGIMQLELAGMRRDYGGLHANLADTHIEFKNQLTRLLEVLFTFLEQTRDTIRGRRYSPETT
jgi:chromosome segregation ATPase